MGPEHVLKCLDHVWKIQGCVCNMSESVKNVSVNAYHLSQYMWSLSGHQLVVQGLGSRPLVLFIG